MSLFHHHDEGDDEAAGTPDPEDAASFDVLGPDGRVMRHARSEGSGIRCGARRHALRSPARIIVGDLQRARRTANALGERSARVDSTSTFD